MSNLRRALSSAFIAEGGCGRCEICNSSQCTFSHRQMKCSEYLSLLSRADSHGFFYLCNRFSGDVLKSVLCSVFSTILLLLGASALSMWLCTRNIGWGPAVKSKWSHWKMTAVTLKKWTALRAMEEPWNSLINKVKSLRVSDWLDSLIGPSELLKILLCSELVTCCFSRYFVMCVGILYEGKWTWIVPIWSGESVVFEYLTLLLKRVLLSMQANDWLTDWPQHSTRETSDGRNCLVMTFLSPSWRFVAKCLFPWWARLLSCVNTRSSKEGDFVFSAHLSDRSWGEVSRVSKFHWHGNITGCLQASCIPPIAEDLSKLCFPKVASDETRFRQLFLEVSRFT